MENHTNGLYLESAIISSGYNGSIFSGLAGPHTNGSSGSNANGSGGENSRQEKMTGFWSDKPDTVEGMMLDSNAAAIDSEEAPEILSYLPNLKEKNVLEIGSGIG